MPYPEHPLRIAIADDSALFRDGLVRQLTAAGMNVSAACSTGDELVARVRIDAPDVVIVDIQMPPTKTDEGIRAARAIRSLFPGVGIMVLSTYLEAAYASEVLAVGPVSVGYLLKDRVTSVDALMEAIERIRSGECVVDSEVVELLLQRPRRQNVLDSLSSRERMVLQLMAEGRSNAGIATEMALAVRTVEAHSAAIFAKLQLHEDMSSNRRVQAVVAWLRRDERR